MDGASRARNAPYEAVKVIRDKAEAMAVYARQAKDQEMILWATEIKVRAEGKAGEMLRDMADSGERAVRGDGPKFMDRAGSTDKPAPQTLSSLGVSKRESHRWQALAEMPAEHFETAVPIAKESAGQVTTTMRTAL